MRFVLASSNEHKAQEVSAMLPDGIDIVTQGQFGVSSVPENGLTFLENALIKARHASKETGLPAIADDSGICVDALFGAPGIYSARYAGEHASDQDNLERLLAAMESSTSRQARFHCVLVCLLNADDPTPLIAEGTCHGVLAKAPSGGGGFGYDPIFLPEKHDCSMAELSSVEKNAISHRGKALKILAELILDRYSA